jgi:hypothetical protein
MNLWDIAAKLGVDPLRLLVSWVRGAPVVAFDITEPVTTTWTAAWNAWVVDWNAWVAANPF